MGAKKTSAEKAVDKAEKAMSPITKIILIVLAFFTVYTIATIDTSDGTFTIIAKLVDFTRGAILIVIAIPVVLYIVREFLQVKRIADKPT